MCNLYTLRARAAELADHLRVLGPVLNYNVGEEVYPGYPGMVMREEDGARRLQSMTWGFPLRLKGMKPESKPKPVNNCADIQKGMWIGLAKKPQWRCIIPFSAFAEAEGAKGSKTRTWMTVKGQPIAGWAGIWRQSDEWGPVYTGVMTDCNETIRPIHDRMPVLLMQDEYDTWLRGSFDEALAFQHRCFPDDLIAIEQTPEPWSKPRTAAAS